MRKINSKGEKKFSNGLRNGSRGTSSSQSLPILIQNPFLFGLSSWFITPDVNECVDERTHQHRSCRFISLSFDGGITGTSVTGGCTVLFFVPYFISICFRQCEQWYFRSEVSKDRNAFRRPSKNVFLTVPTFSYLY